MQMTARKTSLLLPALLIFVAFFVVFPALAQTVDNSQAALSVAQTTDLKGFAKPGDEMTLTVSVTNAASATATAKGVVVTDSLPAGLTYSVDGTVASSFPLGDIGPGEKRSVSFLVKVAKTDKSGFYTNTASVKAENAAAVNVSSDLTVREPLVLAATRVASAESQPKVQVLAATGPGLRDVLIVFAAVGLAVLGIFGLNRASAKA